MSLKSVIVFSLSVVFFIVGVYETMTVGIMYSYWLFMLSGAMILIHRIQKQREPRGK